MYVCYIHIAQTNSSKYEWHTHTHTEICICVWSRGHKNKGFNKLVAQPSWIGDATTQKDLSLYYSITNHHHLFRSYYYIHLLFFQSRTTPGLMFIFPYHEMILRIYMLMFLFKHNRSQKYPEHYITIQTYKYRRNPMDIYIYIHRNIVEIPKKSHRHVSKDGLCARSVHGSASAAFWLAPPRTSPTVSQRPFDHGQLETLGAMACGTRTKQRSPTGI